MRKGVSQIYRAPQSEKQSEKRNASECAVRTRVISTQHSIISTVRITQRISSMRGSRLEVLSRGRTLQGSREGSAAKDLLVRRCYYSVAVVSSPEQL